ncbi:MAG TPA: hypothetical protein VFC65_06145 [Prolixibacteraceae bacterium]|nr:hypothetical protein [Prolixibacteraceae bacterium]
MNLKYKIIFFNVMLFLIIFDIIYLMVWIFSIQMNPAKAVIVAGISALLMPWVRATNFQSGRKIFIRSYAVVLYHKFIRK